MAKKQWAASLIIILKSNIYSKVRLYIYKYKIL